LPFQVRSSLLPGFVRSSAQELVYADHARSLTLSALDKFQQWLKTGPKAFSDGLMPTTHTLTPGMCSLPDSMEKAETPGHSHSCSPQNGPISLQLGEVWQFAEESGGNWRDRELQVDSARPWFIGFVSKRSSF
jgi:hypothetical protein